MSELETQVAELIELLLGDDEDAAVNFVKGLLDSGVKPLDFFLNMFTPAMTEIGDRFGRLDIFLPELIDAADKAQIISNDLIKPLLAEDDSGASMTRGKVVVCSVQGDLHDIGKNMVGMMCEGAGFEVQDLGKDVAPEGFVEAVKEFEPDVVGMSALLTTTMRVMEHTIKALEEAGVRDTLKIMIGGAPVTQSFADQIGADGYASNAASAAEMAKKLVSAA